MNKKYKKILIIVFLAILIVVSCFVLFQKPQEAEAGWWDDTWLYRKPVAITNASTAQTDFQVQITLDTATLITANTMQADCDDIRLTDINSNIIPHWMEPGTCNGASTKIWAKVPSIPASNATVYIYYGNPSAASESSVSDTFIREISGVQGAWDMDGSGAIATNDTTADSSGNGNTGTASNVNTTGMAYASSQFAQGIDFDGTDDYVDCGSGSTLDITDAITIEAWVKSSNSSFEGDIVDRSNYLTVGEDGYGLSIKDGTLRYFIITDTDRLAKNIKSAVCNGNWFHVAVVWNGTNAFGYYNGVLQTTETIGGTMDPNPNELRIGRRAGGSWHFNGTIDGVRVYNQALTQPEITDLYGTGGDRQGYVTTNYANKALVRKYSASVTIGSPGTEEKGPGPVGYWSFDEGYGDTTYDSSDNSNNGTRGGGDAAKKPTWQDESMCVSGKCLHFDGDNDYVDCGSGDSLDILDGDHTIIAWINAQSLPETNNSFLGKFHDSSGTYNGFLFRIKDTGALDIHTFNSNVNLGNVTTDAGDISLQTWYMVAYRVSGTELSLWIDGQKHPTTDTLSDTIGNPTESLIIGNRSLVNNYHFNGSIDEVRIYPYARSAEQIRKDYNAGLAGMGGGTEGVGAALGGGGSQKWMTDGLVGYWKMDESSWTGVADEVVDASGAGNHGVRAGDATTAAGKFGKGGTFDGTGDYVDVGDMTETSAQTVALWVKPDAVNVTEEVFDLNGTQYVKIASGIVTGEGFTSPTVYVDGSVASTITTAWHHVVITTDTGFSASDVDIGRLETSTEFDGSIDQVRIYNRALSPREVRDLYNFAPGPVLHLKMDEKVSGDAQTLYDISTNENNGTTYHGANAAGMDCSIPGKFGTACDFDGTDDYVDCGSGSTLDITDAITIEAWVKVAGSHNNGEGPVFGKVVGGGSPTGYALRITNGGIVKIVLNNGVILDSDETVTSNQWAHVAVGCDGTNVFVSVNGIVKSAVNATTPLSCPYNAAVGEDRAGSTWYTFNGSIDDVRIYNYARTQKQIIQDMNAGHPAVGSPVGSQVGYWKFDEGYGDTANDSSPHNNDGNLAGSCPGDATCPSWTNTGKFNKALSFDGGDYVDVGDTSLTDVRVLSFWAKANDTTEGFIELSASDSVEVASGVVTVTGFGTETVYVDGVATTSFPDTNWHHIAIVSDTDITANTVEVGRVGAIYYTGTIDEVKIYNYALTEDEVRVEYNQGKAIVLGATGTETDGTTPSFSADREYCIPGDTTSCNPPVAEWKMDEKVSGNAQTLYDTSDNANNGTTNWGANTTGMDCTIPGKFGTACEFDGADDYVNCGTLSPSILTTDSFTLEGWAKPNILTSWQSLMELASTHARRGLYFCHTSGNPLYYTTLSDDNLYTFYGTTSGIAIGTWAHIVVTYDYSTKTYKFYQNGEETNSVTRTLYEKYDSDTVLIGKDGSYYGNGAIDQVKIYDYARTPAQVAWSYNRGGPVAEWRFDECQGNTVHDESGNGNDGTITIGGNAPQTVLGTCLAPDDDTGAWYNGVDEKINSAMSFDGEDDYVNVGNTSYTDVRVLSFWAKANDTTEKFIELSASDSVEVASGVVTVTGFGTETVYVDGVTTTSFPDTNWHHVIVVSDTDITANTVEIGRVGATYFNGLIDEVKIYNYALTAEQVRMDYNSGAVNFK